MFALISIHNFKQSIIVMKIDDRREYSCGTFFSKEYFT
jgi:hypothetical protein